MQAIGAFNPAGRATSAFGQVGGVEGLQETPGRHYAPDEVQGAITYDNGVQALLRCGTNAPHGGDGAIHTHKRASLYGTKGFIDWTMWSWEVGVDGTVESGGHKYGEEDILGQTAMTEAMFDWLEDDKAIHPLCMEAALHDFEIMLAIYASGLNRRVVSLPAESHVNLVAAMPEQLSVAYPR